MEALDGFDFLFHGVLPGWGLRVSSAAASGRLGAGGALRCRSLRSFRLRPLISPIRTRICYGEKVLFFYDINGGATVARPITFLFRPNQSLEVTFRLPSGANIHPEANDGQNKE